MIVVRAPFRLPLGGGGTDLPSYYEKYGGNLITAAINKYMYINVNEPAIVDKIKVNYKKVEILNVDEIHKIKHEIVRETLKYLKIKRPIEIFSMADLSAGTGMGSSSAYTVALLLALNVMLRRFIPIQDLAEEACRVEIELIGKPIGKQDQYATTFGGIIHLEIDRQGKVKVTPLNLDYEIIYELENRLMMFYTNMERDANEILAEQSNKIKKDRVIEVDEDNDEIVGVGAENWNGRDKMVNEMHSNRGIIKENAGIRKNSMGYNEKNIEESGSTVEVMHKIKEIGFESKEALIKGNISAFGKLLHEHWITKQKVSSKMSNPQIDNWYNTAINNGALGGKVMGAGGGGFMLFCVDNGKRKHLRKTMEDAGMRYMDFKFDWEGVKTLVNI